MVYHRRIRCFFRCSCSEIFQQHQEIRCFLHFCPRKDLQTPWLVRTIDETIRWRQAHIMVHHKRHCCFEKNTWLKVYQKQLKNAFFGSLSSVMSSKVSVRLKHRCSASQKTVTQFIVRMTLWAFFTRCFCGNSPKKIHVFSNF